MAGPLRVFDVVSRVLPGDEEGLGVVVGIRRSRDGRYTYEVAPLHDDDDHLGGIYGQHQLRATGARKSKPWFWSGPLSVREVVVVSDDHPKEKWRGLYGTVIEEIDGGRAYCVEIMKRDGSKTTSRRHKIDARYLRSTGDRLPPMPVPRPTTTWHVGRGDNNLRPSDDFEIVDELDQYL